MAAFGEVHHLLIDIQPMNPRRSSTFLFLVPNQRSIKVVRPSSVSPLLVKGKAYVLFSWKSVNMGRFPFTKRFRKFRLGCKWNMIFRFVPLENFRKRKGSPVFPLEIFRWNCVFHLRVSQRFTSSRPLTTISSARKYGGYSFSYSSVASVSFAFYECSVCHGLLI